jgi:hypothetical protein
MKTSGILLHILQICTSYFIYICIWLFSIFLFSPYFNEIFMLRLQGVPISFPQPLLNLWVDFNENFRHSSTYIGDVHPKAMQMLYDIMRFDYFQLFWFPILKNGFCYTILEGVPITYPLSLLDLWMDFNETCVNQLQNGKI